MSKLYRCPSCKRMVRPIYDIGKFAIHLNKECPICGTKIDTDVIDYMRIHGYEVE